MGGWNTQTGRRNAHELLPIVSHLSAGELKSWLRGRDLNPRPLGYEPNELPDCSTPRHLRNPHGTTPAQQCNKTGGVLLRRGHDQRLHCGYGDRGRFARDRPFRSTAVADRAPSDGRVGDDHRLRRRNDGTLHADAGAAGQAGAGRTPVAAGRGRNRRRSRERTIRSTN